MPLQAPAEADYSTLDWLVEAVQNHAFTEGFAIVKARSKPNSFGNVVKVVLLCDRGGQPRRRPKAQAKRTDNIKCGCFFKINVVYKKTLDVWTMDVRNAKHNHEENKTSEVSASLRKKHQTKFLLKKQKRNHDASRKDENEIHQAKFIRFRVYKN